MIRSIFILAIFTCFARSLYSQSLFYQDNFRGGIAADGHIYIAGTYLNADTIDFQNNIPAGATLRKAFIITRRIALLYKDTVDTPTHFSFNGAALQFDSSDIVTPDFYCNSSNPSDKLQMCVKDVSAYTLSSGNRMILPSVANHAGLYNYYTLDYVLVTMYDDPMLPSCNVVIYLNKTTYGNFPFAYVISGLNPVNNTNDVGFSVMPGNTNTIDYVDVGLSSSLGTYTIGSLYEATAINDYTAAGSFHYENNSLFGLVDDTPDTKMDSTDALANIKTFLPNNTPTFTVNIDLHTTFAGCTQTVSAFIFAYSSPCPVYQNVSLQDQIICGKGNIVSLGAVDQAVGNSYKWFPTTGLLNSNVGTTTASPTLTTNYVVTITDNQGCHHTEMHRVTVDVIPKIDSIKTQPYVCGNVLGNAVVYTHTNTISPFMYNFGAGFQSSNSISSTGGTYTVVLKDNYGCGDAGSFTISYINPAVAQFSLIPDSICSDLSYQFLNSSSGANIYNWYIDGSLFSTLQNPVHTFAHSQAYTITLIAYNNLPVCADTVSHTLRVLECSISVSAPNIFTPNADNINDTWQLIIAESGSVNATFEIHIFDRWGIEVFESTDKKKGWDGRTTAGLECVEGTYYYLVKYQATAGILSKNEELKGFLQLER